MSRQYDIHEEDGIIVVSVSEDIDIASAQALVDATVAAVPNGAYGVVIDLTGAHYVDSEGIRALFAIADALRLRQQLLYLVIPPGAPLRRILHMVDLHAAAEIHEVLQEAVDVARASKAANVGHQA